jgi:hypothetical protein
MVSSHKLLSTSCKLLGVPESQQKSLLARLIQDPLRDVHQLFTLHKAFTLRLWTQVGVAFRSLPDNLALAACDLCGVACRFQVQVLHGHVGPVELLRKRIVDAWLVHVDTAVLLVNSLLSQPSGTCRR